VLSSNALLTVQLPLGRRLQNGRVIQVGTQAGVPINIRANGRETAVSSSLGYTTNTFSNPTFVSGFGDASVSVDLTVPGMIGVATVLPPGKTFPVGNYSLGLIQFDLAPGAGPLDGGLLFATNPIPISAVNSRSLVRSVSLAACLHSWRQSDLFSHNMTFASRNSGCGCAALSAKWTRRTIMQLHAEFQDFLSPTTLALATR